MSEPKYVTVNIAEDILPLLPPALCSEIRRLKAENDELRSRLRAVQRHCFYAAFNDAERKEIFGDSSQIVDDAIRRL
jgi:hypothetical protein